MFDASLPPETQIAEIAKAGSKARVRLGDSLFFHTSGNGRGSFVFRGRAKGQSSPRAIVIGHWPEVQYSDAVARVPAVRAALAEGVDPAAWAPASTLTANSTFGAVAADYLKSRDRIGRDSRSTQIDATRVRQYLAPISETPIGQLTRTDLRGLLRHVLDTTGKAELTRRCSGLISRIFAHAKNEGILSSSELCRALTKDLLPEKAERHFAAATTLEDAACVLSAIWQGTEGDSCRTARALRILTLFPLRVSSLLAAKWSDCHLDGDRPTWVFRGTKNKQTYTLPVCPALAAELQALKDEQDAGPAAGSDYMFAGGRAGKVLLPQGLRKKLRALGVCSEEQSIHGLRATFSSILEEQGAPWKLKEHALFHKVGTRTDRAYTREPSQERMRTLLQFWADTVKAMAYGTTMPEKPSFYGA